MRLQIFYIISIALVLISNAFALPSSVDIDVGLRSGGKTLAVTITPTGDTAQCVYSLYAATKTSSLNSNLGSATILADRTAVSGAMEIEVSKLKRLKRKAKGKKVYFLVSTRCGINLVTSNIVSLKLKRAKKGLKSVSAWIKKAKKRANKSNTDSDLIATSCSEEDRFEFTNIGEILNSTNVGVDVGTTIADSSSFLRADGKVRKYFIANGRGLVTALSDDGINFSVADGAVLAEGSAAHNKVFRLSDGRYRLYTSVDALGGIVSYISSDETTFTLESGVRIKTADSGLDSLSHLSIVATKDGGYRSYFSNLPKPGGEVSSRFIKSATSSDLVNWTVEKGIRIGPGAEELDGPGEQPHAIVRGQRCVTLFYFKSISPEGQPFGLYYSTSKDGKEFDEEYYSGLSGANGPDVIKLSDGSYLIYYDSGTEETGFNINVARLTLK